MSEASAEQKPARAPDGEPQQSGSSQTGWRARPLGGAIAMGVVVASALVALYLEKKPQLEIAEPLQSIEKRLAKKRRPKWLADLRKACGDHDCACAKKAAGFGLDIEALDAAIKLAEKAERCGPADFAALRAEALVRKGKDAEGLELANKALAGSPKNPHVFYAQALSKYRRGEFLPAMLIAQASERNGRGWSATLLVGLIAYEAGDLERANGVFRSLVASDPNDVDALYNLGVVAQKQKRYGEARTNYIKVTRLEPKHAEARYNLALLAHSVGAQKEAEHHLQLFKKHAPNDRRLDGLRAALAQAPEHGPALSPTDVTPAHRIETP